MQSHRDVRRIGKRLRKLVRAEPARASTRQRLKTELERLRAAACAQFADEEQQLAAPPLPSERLADAAQLRHERHDLAETMSVLAERADWRDADLALLKHDTVCVLSLLEAHHNAERALVRRAEEQAHQAKRRRSVRLR